MIIYVLFITIIYFLMSIYEMTQIVNTKRLEYESSYNIKPNKQKFGISISIGILLALLLSALRFNVGWDYMAYYETIEFGRVTNISLGKEYLTLLLINIARRLDMTQLYFIINSVLTIGLIMETIKRYSKDYWVSFILFLTFPLFFLNSLSVIRNFTAISIIFYGFKYIENRKLIRYLITVTVASLFHTSSIIAVIFYFIANINLKKELSILLLFIAPIFSNILNQIIIRYIPRYASYTSLVNSQQGSKAIVVLFFIAIISIIFKDKLLKKSKNFNMYYNIFFMGIFIYLTFLKQGTLGHRLSLFGTIYSLIIVPDIISLFKHKTDRALIKTALYILCLIMFFYTVNIGKGTYIPYELFFK